ncbi:hypothetical protein PAXRUDRAFT_612365 [Paxillus rubicundulus Ve08.2h10]|uniref:Uncharacterized protein n=1 Tax=Paxillus rubicundulus Ve08.2h10 TaxID=930991 RepID=A0A0D0D596_9AGAM|nr:hypothetical protein PAXRUDRAFT_612365 [Paxillus rubicundulus Ve08.2h10]
MSLKTISHRPSTTKFVITYESRFSSSRNLRLRVGTAPSTRIDLTGSGINSVGPAFSHHQKPTLSECWGFSRNPSPSLASHSHRMIQKCTLQSVFVEILEGLIAPQIESFPIITVITSGTNCAAQYRRYPVSPRLIVIAALPCFSARRATKWSVHTGLSRNRNLPPSHAHRKNPVDLYPLPSSQAPLIHEMSGNCPPHIPTHVNITNEDIFLY